MRVATALLIVALLPASAPAQGRVVRWAALMQAHRPGVPDGPLMELSHWTDADVQVVTMSIRSLAELLYRRPRGSINIDGRSYTADEVRALFGIGSDRPAVEGANTILQLGARLHADVAGLLPHFNGGSGEVSIIVRDGQQIGTNSITIHWQTGRTLLDGVIPSPAADPEVLAWYREVSARILHLGDLSESIRHLARAYQLFPKDAVLLLDAAYLHEQIASPAMRAGIDSAYQLRGVQVAAGSQRAELEQAEKWFRATLAVEPENISARLRLGRVLIELGRPEEALLELHRIVPGDVSADDAYFSRMFLGRAEELLGHLARAREYFQRALDFYPRAQSPLLALNRVARESGDRDSVAHLLDALAALPAEEGRREDPWWRYYEVH